MSLVVRVVAPTGRDAELILGLLRGAGFASEACGDALTLFNDPTGHPLGPLLIAEESLTPPVVEHLSRAIVKQPPWSDLPILILTTGGRETYQSRRLEQQRASLGSAVLLERPIRTATLVSSVRAALRARQRQYQVRDALHERDEVVSQLRSERERLRVIVDSLPVGVFLADSSGAIVLHNPAIEHIIGHAMPGQVPSSNWSLMLADGVRASAEQLPLAIALRTGEMVPPSEFFYVRGDGTRACVSVAASPIRGDDGSVIAAVVAVVDLTSQKHAEAALIQSEKLAAVGRLAASISHEINNPLEAVTNLLYLAAQEGDLSSQTRTYISMAERELARVSQIASQTLRFHRQSTRPCAISAEELVDSVISLHQGRLNNSSIKVTRQYRSSGSVTCYEGEIRQVLHNLIGNAVDSMRSGGVLTVRTQKARSWASGERGVRITVADTGHGMASDVRARVFEAFYTTKGDNGTGLGLWISHGIIQKHHGRLSVATCNRPPRNGTVFSLFLPRELLLPN